MKRPTLRVLLISTAFYATYGVSSVVSANAFLSDEIATDLVITPPNSKESVLLEVSSYNEEDFLQQLSDIEVAASELAKKLQHLSFTPEEVEVSSNEFSVPFFSQFADISSPQWQKVGCGIASVAMLIEHYEPDLVSVEDLLADGISAGYFLADAGWTHAGLINLAKPFGLIGGSFSLSDLTMDSAFEKLTSVLNEGPVMASVHYTFEPTNPIPHLVVVNGVKDGLVYYNDPAEDSGGGSISVSQFKSAWKKRYIAIRPGS